MESIRCFERRSRFVPLLAVTAMALFSAVQSAAAAVPADLPRVSETI